MKLALHWQILIAIGLATLVGLSVTQNTSIAGVALYGVFDFLGTLFLNALKMLIVPLVMASIICGISGIGGAEHLGRMGGKTLGFYLLSSLLAILAGLLLVNLIEPGIVNGVAAQQQLSLSSSDAVSIQLSKVEGRGLSDIVQIFVRMVPPNIVRATAEGQMLGLIFFSLLFGFFMTQLEAHKKETMLHFWQGVQDVMMKMTLFIMKFAPLGVFGLVAKTISSTGLQAFVTLGWFVVTVVLALAVHALITMPVLLKTLGGINPIKHYRAMGEALLTAFSTASSSATLPLTIECMEKKAGVSNRTTAFVLPLGATVNMDGTALYECVAAIFIAQAYGLDLSLTTQFTVVLIALLTSIGVAGIPSASLVAITVILSAVGLPLEGIGLLLVTDRILDMLRTAVNVYGDSCCAAVIASSEGEDTRLV